MRRTLILLVLFTLSSTIVGQKTLTYFKLTDSSFKIGSRFIFRPFYGFDGVGQVKDDEKTLDSIITILKKHPTLQMKVVSHCDPRPSDDYKNLLTIKRSDDVTKLFIANGIDSTRIIAFGMGSKEPFLVDYQTQLLNNFLPLGQELSEKFIYSLDSNEKRIAAFSLNPRLEFIIIKE